MLGPFDRLESPWLPLQGIVPESDDGVIVARGQLAGKPAVIMAIEGAFQGGGMGEVSASKIAGALGLARRDCESGKPILPVLLLETGGVRLQEANLGEAVVAEIHAEIIALRRHVPVIGVITGMVGCFGGMSITAGLCSYLVVLPQARLELNGPEVIEQEAGIDELDASDKHLIWSLMGGQQRYETGFADALIEDDAKALRQTIQALAARGVPARHRSEKVEEYRRSLAKIDPAAPPDGPACAGFGRKERCHEHATCRCRAADGPGSRHWPTRHSPLTPVWGACLSPTPLGEASGCGCSRLCRTRRIAFLEPGTANSGSRRDGRSPTTCVKPSPPIIPAPGGRSSPSSMSRARPMDALEALLGIHLSLAAAADAYATARMAGHPVVALIVGTALSGGLLAHGDQAHRLLALDDPQVIVQAMRKQSAARITRRTVEELDELGKTVIPMAYDIRQFAKLGLLHELITGIDADAPSAAQIAQVKERVAAAIADIRKHPGDLTSRLNNPEAKVHRAASIEVRRRLAEQWNA